MNPELNKDRSTLTDEEVIAWLEARGWSFKRESPEVRRKRREDVLQWKFEAYGMSHDEIVHWLC